MSETVRNTESCSQERVFNPYVIPQGLTVPLSEKHSRPELVSLENGASLLAVFALTTAPPVIHGPPLGETFRARESKNSELITALSFC